jgi:hypothetical protein
MPSGSPSKIPLRARLALRPAVTRMLFARSGGFCANPTCRADLFPAQPKGKVASLGELAHIIAHSDAGPRADPTIPKTARDAYDNILLLCPTCHTLVDKMDLNEVYDAALLREWKREHEERIARAIDVPEFGSREQLDDEISALLLENRACFNQYGPHSAAARNPLSDVDKTWLREARRVIIPNNWRIMRLLDVNRSLLDLDERRLAADFKVHAEGFAQNHLSGELNAHAPTFPTKMNDVFVHG